MRTRKPNHHKNSGTDKAQDHQPAAKKEETEKLPHQRNIISFETPSKQNNDKSGHDENYGW